MQADFSHPYPFSTTENRPKTDKSPQPAPPNPIPIEPDVPLKSEFGVDYTKLRNLLVAKKWKEADQETARVLLKAADREKEGWLDTEDIEKFPCEDLRTIDQLWVKYSNGRFGFSVQKRIYESLGGTREFDDKIWKAFGDRIGWTRKDKGWMYYKNLTFSEKAPGAHLPVLGLQQGLWGFWDGGMVGCGGG